MNRQGRILILDPDADHAKALASALAERRYDVFTCGSEQAALHHLGTSEVPFDVMIIVLCSDIPKDWGIVASIPKFTMSCKPKPMILCASRVYRGPQIRLEAERKGARLVYERSI